MALAGPAELPNVLDVIENSLGARPTPEQLRKLTIRELEGLAGVMEELSNAQSEENIPGGASLVGGWLHGFWSEPILRADLGKALLYYSNLVVLDPLADFFDDRSGLPITRPIRFRRPDGVYNSISGGPKMWSVGGAFMALREQPDRAAAKFSAIVGNLYSLERLIRTGVVVLRSQWPTIARRAPALETSVRHDVHSKAMQAIANETVTSAADAFAVWDNMRGGTVTMSGDLHPSDAQWQNQHVFYYLAKTLAVADAAGAQYVPSTERDLQLLRTKANSSMSFAHPSRFLDEVARVVVPSFDIPIEQAVSMRQSSEGFEDWRSMLDSIRRAGTEDSAEVLRERVQEELRPKVRALERELARTSSLATFHESAADMIVTGSVAGAAAIATGGNLGVAVGAVAATGVLSWIRRAYGLRSPDGANGVLAALVRGGKKS